MSGSGGKWLVVGGRGWWGEIVSGRGRSHDLVMLTVKNFFCPEIIMILRVLMKI